MASRHPNDDADSGDQNNNDDCFDVSGVDCHVIDVRQGAVEAGS
jgi:hypothetical protein